MAAKREVVCAHHMHTSIEAGPGVPDRPSVLIGDGVDELLISTTFGDPERSAAALKQLAATVLAAAWKLEGAPEYPPTGRRGT
jgi:hypothetical protein